MANLSVFEHLGPYTSTFRAVVFTVHPHVIIYSHWPNEFFAPNGQSRVWRRCLRAKNKFLFEMVQKVPDGPKTFGKRVSNGQKHLGWPFWSLFCFRGRGHFPELIPDFSHFEPFPINLVPAGITEKRQFLRFSETENFALSWLEHGFIL